jgi:hypothetical protein
LLRVSKTSVKRFLALYFLILFGAIFLRVDYFPLSWVPMYGYREIGPQLTVKFGDKSGRKRGFFAQRANGETLYISAEDLNVPNANFRRLYHQRAYNNAPPQDDRERVALMSFNRWWYETFVGPDPRLNKNYSGQLLDSVNQTFGYGPSDPRRIARLEASLDFATYDREHLDIGDLSRPKIERRTAIITETGSFLKRGDRVAPMLTGMASKAGEVE